MAKIDKRTKEYKKSRGLGDEIAKFTEATGIKKLVELFTPEGKDCGCDKRQEALNKTFPNNKPNCFNKQQYDDWTAFRNRSNQDTVTNEQQMLIIKTLREILNVSIAPCSTCSGSIWKNWISKIDKVYDVYEK